MLKSANFGYRRFLVFKLCSRKHISNFAIPFCALLLFSQVRAQSPERSEQILKNGTRILAVNLPNAEYFSVQIFFRGGSVYETPETNGLHHLLEHLQFRRLDSKNSFGVLDFKIEALGCSANAFTYREFSRIVIEGPNESLHDAIKYIGDFFQNDFSEQAIKQEIEIIEEEIALQKSDSYRVMEWALWETAFPKSTWSSRTCGDPAKLREISKRQLLETAKKFHVGGNILVVIVGKLHSRKILELATAEFEGFSSGDVAPPPALPEITPTRNSLESRWGESFVGLGFRAGGLENLETYFATRIFVEVLCGGIGRFRKAGLDVRFAYDFSKNGTLLTMIVREELSSSENLETRTRKILSDFARNGITKKEFVDAVRYLRAREKYLVRSPKDLAFLLGVSALFGKEDITLAANKYYSELTLEKVNHFAKRFHPDNAVFIVWEK